MLELHLIVDANAEDIAVGVPRKNGECPLARATLRAAGEGASDVSVGLYGTYLVVQGKLLWCGPHPAQKPFIEAFDDGRRVRPVRYPITLREAR